MVGPSRQRGSGQFVTRFEKSPHASRRKRRKRRKAIWRSIRYPETSRGQKTNIGCNGSIVLNCNCFVLFIGVPSAGLARTGLGRPYVTAIWPFGRKCHFEDFGRNKFPESVKAFRWVTEYRRSLICNCYSPFSNREHAQKKLLDRFSWNLAWRSLSWI